MAQTPASRRRFTRHLDKTSIEFDFANFDESDHYDPIAPVPCPPERYDLCLDCGSNDVTTRRTRKGTVVTTCEDCQSHHVKINGGAAVTSHYDLED